MGAFDGNVCLVTGGSSGIGRATALAFAREGARVVIADVEPEEGEILVGDIRRSGGEALFVRADVSVPADVQRMVRRTVSEYGGLDLAFNNGGIEPQTAPTAEVPEEDWDRVVAINLKGVWLCMRAEIPAMLARGRGAIVNGSSVAGLVGFAGSAAYVAAKHGVVGLTRTAALDYATAGIRVNAVCPGVIRTPMIDRIVAKSPEGEAPFTALEPVGRMGTPEEVAAAVLWLCSDGASFVTGHALAVDGGLVAR